MVKATDCKSVFYEFEPHSCLNIKNNSTVTQWLVYPTVSRKVAGSNPVSTASLGYNKGSLLTLDARGCKFEIRSIHEHI